MIDKQSALLNCPFCGGRAEQKEASAPHGGMVSCQSCGAEAFGPKWNRRASDVCDKASVVSGNSQGNVTLTDAIERIIIRRVYENKVDGYTLGMAKEIAALVQYGEVA